MKLQVKEIMTSAVVTVNDTDSIDHVVSLMLRHHISGVPVVNDDNIVQGVITECDLLCLLANVNTDKKTVADYATFNAVVVHPHTSLVEVVELMTEHPYRRLPVIDEEGKLVGIVSRRDLIRFIRDLRARLANVMSAPKGKQSPALQSDSSAECTVS